MKFIRIISDLHLECDREDDLWVPSQLPTDHDTTLVVAGDIWYGDKFLKTTLSGFNWLDHVSSQFKHVVFVLGNHDYWHTNFSFFPRLLKTGLRDRGYSNVHFLEKDTVVLEGVRFVGASLWTDYNNQNPLAILDAQQMMNDFNFITVGRDKRRLQPSNLYHDHREARRMIFKNVQPGLNEDLVVVVTHHAPSYQSLLQRYLGDRLSSSFASNLDQQIIYQGEQIKYWFHGHVHNSNDYQIDKTRIISNPRGYHGHGLNDEFDDKILLPV